MAESEERPSKIRRLNSSDGSPDPLQGDSTSIDLPSSQAVQADHNSENSKVSQVPSTINDPPLSRNQLKKLRKREQWAAGKEFRKEKRRTLHHEKQARKVEARVELLEKVAKGEIPMPEVVKPKGFRRPIQTPVAFVLDCDFNELMAEKELISLSAQITRSYSDNKSNPYRAHLAISSWGGPLKDRFENVLSSNHLNWKGFRFFEGDFVAAAKELDGFMRGPEGGKPVGALAGLVPKSSLGVSDSLTSSVDICSHSETLKPEQASEAEASTTEAEGKPESAPEPEVSAVETSPTKTREGPGPSIVYLTSDSDTTLSVLSPNTTYIIGGIVDKNRHKGLCYKRATERGIPTARLPIGEYMTMQSRSVLAVNHVVEIMLAWMETGDWGEAFLKVIPKRKEAKLKTNGKGQPTAPDKGEKQGEGQDYVEGNGAATQAEGAFPVPESDETNGEAKAVKSCCVG